MLGKYSVYSNLHGRHLLLDRGPAKSSTASDVRRLARFLSQDLRGACGEIDTAGYRKECGAEGIRGVETLFNIDYIRTEGCVGEVVGLGGLTHVGHCVDK